MAPQPLLSFSQASGSAPPKMSSVQKMVCTILVPPLSITCDLKPAALNSWAICSTVTFVNMPPAGAPRGGAPPPPPPPPPGRGWAVADTEQRIAEQRMAIAVRRIFAERILLDPPFASPCIERTQWRQAESTLSLSFGAATT